MEQAQSTQGLLRRAGSAIRSLLEVRVEGAAAEASDDAKCGRLEIVEDGVDPGPQMNQNAKVEEEVICETWVVSPQHGQAGFLSSKVLRYASRAAMRASSAAMSAL